MVVITHSLEEERKNTRYGAFATTSRLISCLILEDLVTAYFLPTIPDMNGSDISNSKMLGLCLVFGIPDEVVKEENASTNTTMPALSLSTTVDNSNYTTATSYSNLYAVVGLRGISQLNHEKFIHLGNEDGIIQRCYKIENVTPWDMLPPYIFGITTDLPSEGTKCHPIYSEFTTLAAFTDNVNPGDHNSTFENTVKRGSYQHNSNANSMLNYVSKILEPILNEETSAYSLTDCYDSVQLWERFIQGYPIPQKFADAILFDCASSMMNQIYAYNHPKKLPTLKSSPDEWEQALLEGHQYFPMHKSVVNHPFTSPLLHTKKLETPKIRLVSIPLDSMELHGDFIGASSPLVDAILSKTGENSLQEKYINRLLLPVHELQVDRIQQKIEDVVVLPEVNHVEARSLSSIRSVAVPEILDSLTLKLPIGMRIGGSIRTITRSQARFAFDFSQVVSRISYDPEILDIQFELASAIHSYADDDNAQHCSCIIRQAKEFSRHRNEDDNDIYIVSAALLEKIQKPDTNETLVTHVWNLDTEEKRVKFLDRYVCLLLQAFVPPCRDNGLIFESHLQNTIARFDGTSGKLKGFLIRDLDGVEVYYPTFKATCGLESDYIATVESLETLYASLNYSVFQTHLQPLIQVLGLDQCGWKIVRTHFSSLISHDHPMYNFFMEQKTVPVYCYLRTRIGQGHCPPDYSVYRPKPNILLSGAQGPNGSAASITAELTLR